MPAPNPAAFGIFTGCEAKANDLIAGVFDRDRTSGGLRQAAADLNAYADVYIASFQTDYRAQGGDASACQAGCAYCCHGPVHLTPIELLNIVLHLASSAVSVAQRTLLRQRIGEKTTVISGMTVQAQMERTITCPFLLENRCSIYAVRPLLCRGRNSFDATPCQAVYADPTQAGQFVLLQEQMLVSQCLVLGILTALKKIGLPDRCIDLCLALDVSLRNPDMVERWLQGEDPLLAC